MADIITRQAKGIALTFDEVDANFQNLNQGLATVTQAVEGAAKKGEIVNADIANNAAIADSKLATIASNGKVANSATSASSSNTPDTIVARDNSGNFSAGTITASLNGNASTSTRLQTARTINGVAFDGTADISIASSSTFQALAPGSFISATGSFDGSVARTFSVDATNNNTPSKVVARDGSGGFSAGSVSLASLSVTNNGTFGSLSVTGATSLGTATATTPVTASNDTNIATTAYVQAQGYAPLASPALTGTPTVPTAAVATDSTQAASTAYVVARIANDAPTKTGGGASGTWSIGVNGNAGTATKLQTARTINGVSFDGTLDITIPTGGTSAALTAGSYLTSTGTFNGSVARTFAVDATSANTPNKVVARDSSNNFSAGTITAALNGNASTATKLQTARSINGVPFDGTLDITIQASSTASSLTAGSYLTSTGDFNGSVARTFSVDAATTSTPLKVVARDNLGGFAAGPVTLDSLGVTNASTLGGAVKCNSTLEVTGTTTLGAANATTPATNSNGTAIATTAYVQNQGYAPKTSPTFDGTPSAPTAAVNTSTTQLATTAFVINQASITAPVVAASTAAVGTSLRYARADHVHPATAISFTTTGGTTAGPTLTITQAGVASSVAIPSASSTASGAVTTGAQTFAGAKTLQDRTEIATTGDLFSGAATAAIADTTERFFLSAATGVATGTFCGSSASVLNVFRVSTDGNFIRFTKGGASALGQISVTGSTVSYTNNSDYRLKENIVPLADALNRLRQIPVCRFNFIDSPGRTMDGFLAHEVQNIVPEAITGEKDGMQVVGNIVDRSGKIIETAVPRPASLEDGLTWTATGEKPVFQQIDQSKLVPLLTAALQELLQRVESLETQLAGV